MIAWRGLACWIVPAMLILVVTHAAHAGAPSVCFSRLFDANHFTVCRADTRSQMIWLAWTDAQNVPIRSFDRLKVMLGPKSVQVQFAMNAGMFDATGSPIGLFVEHGVSRVSINLKTGSGNFYMQPNGVFWVDRSGDVGITQTRLFSERRSNALWATQSGPMLVINGAINSNISPNGPSRYIRNGVGVFDAHTAYFVLSDEPVSFGKFARLFKEQLKCRNALYLDGFVSSLWAPSIHRADAAHPLGPMIVVSSRQRA